MVPTTTFADFYLTKYDAWITAAFERAAGEYTERHAQCRCSYDECVRQANGNRVALEQCAKDVADSYQNCLDDGIRPAFRAISQQRMDEIAERRGIDRWELDELVRKHDILLEEDLVDLQEKALKEYETARFADMEGLMGRSS